MNKLTLKEVSELITKGTTPSSVGCEFVKSGINFIKSESISGFKYLNNSIYEHIDLETDRKLKRSRIKAGDLLFSIAGAYLGKIAIVQPRDVPANTNQAVGIVRLKKDKVNVDYVYYYFSQKHINAYVNKLSSQSSQPNLNLDLLGKLEFDCKDLNAQLKIACILSALDSKIEINNRINAELEEMAKTLYDYWFVQFDFPDKNGKPYKSSGGKMVWSEKLKREIPEGWEVTKLKEVLTIRNGRDHKNLESGIIPVYGSGGIMRHANKFLYDSESILIPRKGTLSNLFYVNQPFWCVDTIFYTQMRFAQSCKYLFYSIRAFNISSMNTGTAVPSMTTEVLNNLKIAFPPFEILNSFDIILSPIFQMKDKLAKEDQELTELRDWLLPMLMNGQIKVSS